MSPGENSKNHHHHGVFSAEKAGHLDTRLRRFLYHPDPAAEKYVKPGNRVLDFGCGPGFFTREFAKRVGDGGQVFSVDVQEEMLNILREKLGPAGLLPRIRTHQCEPDSINLPPDLNGTFDVAFTVFVVHEVPDPAKLFREIALLLSRAVRSSIPSRHSSCPGRNSGRSLRSQRRRGSVRLTGRCSS